MKFQGTQSYIATEDLMLSVNAAITLQRPLLVKGEPGTGKTMLAEEVATALNLPLLQWHIKSTTKAQQGLYEYDAVSRLRDSQLADVDGGERVRNIHNYIVKGVLWQAFTAEQPVALLIDEIDKADSDFQDDMLDVLDQMQFDIIEIDKTITARRRPVIIITSNAKKDLSDPFLGRCNFHHIAFPDAGMMRLILGVHYPDLSRDLADGCIEAFYRLRDLRGIEKKPATRELINWVRALKADPDFQVKSLARGNLPYLGILFKKSADLNAAVPQMARMR
ncbi:MoxR family ATPase [Rhodoferax sp.]|uniref:AAA family ATPase n=1 Tax=Rhodoferax sp. TaxID=50421 RepID=UPI002AB834DA|nr:MoxR family ATPase [Rhodoferax sp.]MDZ4207573.1 MoxR family ATPase [Rhodoferax sp.]